MVFEDRSPFKTVPDFTLASHPSNVAVSNWLSRRAARLLSEAAGNEKDDARQAAESDYGVADPERHEFNGAFGRLKRRHEPEDAEGGNGQEDQASSDSDDDSHGPSDCKVSDLSEFEHRYILIVAGSSLLCL
jgi:hypothetical protein